ncbi:MAG: aminopeptidase [Phycisphaeraceae bacterium]
MRDPRLDKLARVLIEYSTQIKPGQIVRLTGAPVAIPLLEALYEAALKAGAFPYVKCQPDTLANIFFQHASEEQLKHVSPLALHEIETIDVSIGLWADTNTKSLSRVDPKRQGLASAARKPIMQVFMKRAAAANDPNRYPGVKPLRWTGTQFPTAASAQDAEMSLTEYEDFVFRAGHLDKEDPVAEWLKIQQQQQKVVDYLTGKKEIRFQTPRGTDLTVNIEGMRWVNCCGHENFPDGEVFTGPNLKAPDGGVNGVVKYSFPAVHHGREVHDIELTFEKGRVVDAKASKNQQFLIDMLDQDPGARSLGEIALGTNFQITEYTKNTLFDEKIGGTFHAAVGAGYPETGNDNASGLHWDMVCDMRPEAGGGTVTVDGEVISRDGRFVFDGWPGNE